jgi:hypothetical protein
MKKKVYLGTEPSMDAKDFQKKPNIVLFYVFRVHSLFSFILQMI